MNQDTTELLVKIKQERPFIFYNANFFPIGIVASGVRSLGAFTIMSGAEQEIEELLTLSKSLVIHLGKLDDEFIKLSNHLCKIANKMNVPIILDPVGAGASKYRTNAALNLMKQHKISIIRAYPNEIAALLNGQVDLLQTQIIDDKVTIDNAKSLSKKYNSAVVVSGKKHIVIDSDKMDQFNFDSQVVQKVAGISGLLSSIIGVFNTVEPDRFLAGKYAVSFYANCIGPISSKVSGPASLTTELIDRMYMESHNAMLYK